MSTNAQSLDRLMDQGIVAYRDKEFKKAIESLQQVLDVEPQHWRAKLYLAMSYFHSGEVFTAYRHFAYLKDNCIDAEIRAKAESALKAMSSQVQAQGVMPEMTCTLNKNMIKINAPGAQLNASKAQKVDDIEGDGADGLEWVSTEQT